MHSFCLYKIPLKTNCINSKNSYIFQEIIFIKLANDDYLEISPLQNFNQENSKDIIDILSNSDNKSIDLTPFPSLEYSLYNNKMDARIAEVKTAILINTNENLTEKINHHYPLGFCTYKIKLGKENLKNKIQEIRKIKNKYPNIKIRADFNNCFSLEELDFFCKEIKNVNFEFVEGLLKNTKDYWNAKLEQQKICIDVNGENLIQTRKLIDEKRIQAITMKPKVIGSKKKILSLAKECKNKNINVVISSSFETILNIENNLKLAQEINTIYNKDIIHGLGTSEYLTQTSGKIEIKNSHIKVLNNEFCIEIFDNYKIGKYKKIANRQIIEILNAY